jgi:hypothetical protein
MGGIKTMLNELIFSIHSIAKKYQQGQTEKRREEKRRKTICQQAQ